MNNLGEIKKRLAYAENNNLFDAHYINDMKKLLNANKLDNQVISALKKESEKYRQEAKNERELSESIVAERERLIIENEKLKKMIEKFEMEEKTCL